MRNVQGIGTGTAALHAMGARMSQSEIAQGRFLRGPDADGHGNGGGDSNNQQGNTGNSQNGNGSQNNTGQEFDPASFWVDPGDSNSGAPNSGSSASSDSGSSGSQGNQQQNQNQGDQGNAFDARISALKAPPVFTDAATKGFNEGNDEELNKNLDTLYQSAVRESTNVAVDLMKAIVPKLMERMQAMIGESHTKKEDYSELHAAIPSSKNPVLEPIVKPIYERALALAKGDRTKAIGMTKQMLKSLTGESAKDLDLSVAPAGSDSNGPAPAATNWMEELMGPS